MNTTDTKDWLSRLLPGCVLDASRGWTYQLEVDYDLPEETMRQDLIRSGYDFFSCAERIQEERGHLGRAQVQQVFFLWDVPVQADTVVSAMGEVCCAPAMHIELKALALEIEKQPKEKRLETTPPFQCLGTRLIHPEYADEVSVPSFLLDQQRITWDLPLLAGIFPAEWIFVGIYRPELRV